MGSKTHCAWLPRIRCAQDIAPSSLVGSSTMYGNYSREPSLPICHKRRAQVAIQAAWGRQNRSQKPKCEVVPAPRHAEQPAGRAAASHRAVGAPILPIEGARHHALGTSTGAVPGFWRFSAQGSLLDALFARRGWRLRARGGFSHLYDNSIYISRIYMRSREIE